METKSRKEIKDKVYGKIGTKRRDKNTLFVKLDENNSENERLLTIVLEAGNYFDYVNVRQSVN